MSVAETAADSPAAATRRALSSPAWRWLAAACGVFVSDLLLHLPITDVCDTLVRRFGFETYDLVLRRGFLGLGAVMVAVIALRRSPQRGLLLASAGALVGVALVFQRVLLVSGIENIHYPQYALIVWLLMQGGLPGESAYLASTGLGIADEGYQLATMPRGTPGYFDWNDVVLNALGAAFGVVLVLALRRNGELTPRRLHRVWIGFVAAAIMTFLLSPPMWTPFYSVTPGGRVFHKLAGFEAVIAVAALWAAVRGVAASVTAISVNRSR